MITKRQHALLKKRERRNKIKNLIIGCISGLIFLSLMYVGLDYAAYQDAKQFELKMQQQMEWRGKWIEKN